MRNDPAEIFQRNLDKEERHQGESHLCHKCNLQGVVGNGLWAAFHESNLEQGHYWIHEACARS